MESQVLEGKVIDSGKIVCWEEQPSTNQGVQKWGGAGGLNSSDLTLCLQGQVLVAFHCQRHW